MNAAPSNHNRINNWRTAFVYGLGVSGRAATRLLIDRGVSVIAHDEREERKLDLDLLRDQTVAGPIEWALGQALESLPDGVDVVVLSPGVPTDRPLLEDARRKGVEIVAEVELAFRALDQGHTVVAITGSNGKSTTTALTGRLLREAGYDAVVCGNIGEPMSGCIPAPGSTVAPRVFVVELSSFQLEATLRFHPNAAALLNVAPDHLDRYRDFDDYRSAKERIFRTQGAEDVAVLNADDLPLLHPRAVQARKRYFSTTKKVQDGCYLAGAQVLEVTDGDESPLFQLDDLTLPGLHNVENAMAASLLARALGAERPGAGLRSFVGLPHRIELVRELGGVRYFDDSKGTNMAATARSLEGFDPRPSGEGSVHLILGGRNKDGDPAELRTLVESRVKCLYLIGESADLFARALEGYAVQKDCRTLDRALSEASACAQAGDVVLLSPACASFDQFDSYAHRGDVFKALVADLADAEPTDVDREEASDG